MAKKYDDSFTEDDYSLVSFLVFAVLFVVLIFVQRNSKERLSITDWIMQL